MSHFDSLKATRNEVGISKNVPITHLNSPAIFESKNSMIGMVIKLEGVPFSAEKDELLNQYKRIWHRALTALDDRFAVYSTVHRHKESMTLNGEFESDFCRELDAEYHQQFRNSNMYINDLYLTIIYKGITSGKSGKGLSFLGKLTNKVIKSAREAARQQQIKSLTQAVNQLKETLSAFEPRVVGEDDTALGYSELVRFLSLAINGGNPITAPFIHKASPIGKSLVNAKKEQALYPHGNLSQFLSKYRIFMGEYIQFQGMTEADSQYAAIVTIKHYGSETASIMFDTLLHLDTDLISTNTYAVEAKDIALNKIDKHARRLKNSGDKAISQLHALHTVNDLIAGDTVTMGYHHNTVMLLAKSPDELEKKVVACVRCYADAGFVAVRETFGQEPAFWAQVPTNFRFIARSSLVTSENFVDFASLHNYRTGFIDGNHLGSAVTILKTPSKTPYRLNFHTRGTKDNPSKGHTIIIGGNDSGKTVFMTFTDAQEKRYGGNSYVFDRDRGQEIYVRAKGGAYAVLSPNYPENCCFSPLILKDTKSNRQFNRDLLIQLCKNNEEDELDADIIKQLTDCINYAYDDLAPSHRTLTNATQILPISFPRWPNLKRWLKGGGQAHDGEYAYLFDNDHDQLTLQKDMGFDMTHFLDNEPAHVRTALMMYLFHRIDLSLDGTLTRVDLDEAWQYFIDPYWKAKLERVLPTWRKRNAHLVMATQSPSSVVKTALRHVILDNVATQIYFANPQAKKEDYIDGLKLTTSEYEIIKNSPPQARLFLLKQGHDAVVCQLNLSTMKKELTVLSGNEVSVGLLNKLRNDVGDDPKNWLPLFYNKKEDAQ